MYDLTDPISKIKGIGPKKQKLLNKLEVSTVEDLLYFYPRAYEDRRNKVKINKITAGKPSVILGTVISKSNPQRYGKKNAPFKVLVKDDTGAIEMVFFRSAYIDKLLNINEEYIFFGIPELNINRIQIIHPEFTPASEGYGPEILPVYPSTSGLGQRDIRKWLGEIIQSVDHIHEYLPEDTITRNNLCGISYALKNIHFPTDKRKYSESRYRLVFEELLELQVGLTRLKNKNISDINGIKFDSCIDTRIFTDSLPYTLTGAQARTVKEIINDMNSSKPMNRLVQGDVGSGKTVVAATAMFKAVKSGYQAVMMAPTEILALQHYKEIQKFYSSHDIRVGYLTGSMKKTEKEDTILAMKNGELDVIVGTHALIQENVEYKNLGLAITDEQHRFGVKQRIILSDKGKNLDVLVMTATPIPRTLAFILYGDLDVSIIDELPPGRQKIKTDYINNKGRTTAYNFVKKQIQSGRQAYVVAPLIENSEVLEQIKSAEDLYNELNKKFKEHNTALLHGNMKQHEKDEIMAEFNDGNIDILVSTVVIEVGINVKNATVMVIENAERFGLAQLHQLRGRVGRGEHKSYCLLISDSETDDAKERLTLMTQTENGFDIAERDLEMRGPGDFFGTRQHGLPKLRISDLIKHREVLNKIKEEADILLTDDPDLKKNNNKLFRQRINKMFSQVSDIGL